MDEQSWNTLSSSEQRNINTAISDGLGLIIMPEKGKLPIKFTTLKQKDTVRISLGTAGTIRLPALTLEAKQSNPLLTSGDRVLSGFNYSGAGKIGYQLLLENIPGPVSRQKTRHILHSGFRYSKNVREQKEDLKLRITSPFPYYENEPLSFDIISSGKQPTLRVDNTQLPLTEDIYIDDLWHGTVWFEGNQWHEMTADSTKTFVPVSKEGTWKAARAANNRKATQQNISNQNTDEVTATTDDNTIKLILFLIFLFSAGFLWLAPKI
ncbi:MAG: hypothetical protein WDO15_18765 [Bacteroidota bacterium]